MQCKGEMWVWTVTLYNLPIHMCYHCPYQIDLLISYGAGTPINLESFAFPIFKRLAECASGFWLRDSMQQSYFLWKAGCLFILADLMGAIKVSGLSSVQGVKPCPKCEIVSATKESGRGRYLVHGPRVMYIKEVGPQGKTHLVNGNWLRAGYLSLANKAPNWTLSSHRLQINAIWNEDLSKKERDAHKMSFGISSAPLVTRSILYDIPSFFPPDIAHLLFLNIPAHLCSHPNC
jgi:hypothetical protein